MLSVSPRGAGRQRRTARVNLGWRRALRSRREPVGACRSGPASSPRKPAPCARQCCGSATVAQIAVGEGSRGVCRPGPSRRSCPCPAGLASSSASRSSASRFTTGTASPVHDVADTSSRRPRRPAGCEREVVARETAGIQQRQRASASPTASAAVVLAVGARLCGRFSTRRNEHGVGLARGGVRSAVAGGAMSLAPMRLMIGRISRISSVSPEFDSANTTSAGVIKLEVAVRGLAWMHEERRRAGGGERGGDLAADVTGIWSHAGDDYAPGAGEDDPAGAARVARPRVEGARLALPPRSG